MKRDTMAVLAVALLATGCSSGGAASVSPHSGEPISGPAAAAAVKARWLGVFNNNVPILQRLSLLQDGQAFASFVKAQEKTTIGALVFEASGTVSSVKVHPHGLASVVYSILLGGKPLEKNIAGTAVYSGGKWRVSKSTFCGLLFLAFGKTSKQIPQACKG